MLTRVDPACGMLLDETSSADEVVYRDQCYVFCSAECRAAFIRNPDAYLKDHSPDRLVVTASPRLTRIEKK